MRNIILTVGLYAFASGLAAPAAHPVFSGSYVIENSKSTSDFAPVSRMTVAQTARWIRMKQADKDGLTAHSVQGYCLIDGVVHAVPEADAEWIQCSWEGDVLVTQQRWTGAERRTIRTMPGSNGTLVQDVKTTGAAGPHSAHLVWVKQSNATAPVEDAAPAPTPEPGPAPLPKPFATPSADNHQQVDKDSTLILHSLEGFEVTAWAKGLDTPRFMLQAPGGEILLSDSAAHGSVYVFGHGNPRERKALLTDLDRPYGLAFWRNYLYVAEAESIKRYTYDAAALTVGKGEEIVSMKGMGKGHWTRSLLFDAAGEKLYVGIGAEENVAEGGDPRRAAINRYNPDGSGHEIFASGLRNPVGLHWYPSSPVLWAAVEERDGLGDDLVPDYFTHVEKGGFYGWPWTYLGANRDPRMKPPPANLAAKTVEPDHLLGSHVAALDFAFYTGDQFPAEYRGGAFVAMHGSWNRSQRVGYKVVFIPFDGAGPSGNGFDFVAGWTDTADEKTVLGRPVAVLQTADGSLLISDDGRGTIWKVSYRAHQVQGK